VTWTVDLASSVPPSRQLVEAALDALSSGRLAAGDRLPSVRGLAAAALVNHNTVARAYRDLEQRGVVKGWNGRGVFVTPRGFEIAKEERRTATLEAFERAAQEALRAGHEPASLRALLAEVKREQRA
jgi:GntR family transcriptional regulator